ncbi:MULTISPECIES: SH3 domain-containing protein [unclassified Streptomyces]|uniref:SH3 domain-containing protein n=1 Tax=unclassified Streptomyces TaxID=2593676 RepID=UPI002E172168|nr:MULTISPECIES: SH3 domain-containing protein [unclassified Streptomyces]
MRTLHKTAALAATALVATGGIAVSAPTASAATSAGSSACNLNTKNTTYKTTTAVKFRSGPSTGYTSRGRLGRGTRVYVVCFKDANYGVGVSNGYDWAYGKITSGANKGKVGWVADSYLKKA